MGNEACRWCLLCDSAQNFACAKRVKVPAPEFRRPPFLEGRPRRTESRKHQLCKMLQLDLPGGEWRHGGVGQLLAAATTSPDIAAPPQLAPPGGRGRGMASWRCWAAGSSCQQHRRNGLRRDVGRHERCLVGGGRSRGPEQSVSRSFQIGHLGTCGGVLFRLVQLLIIYQRPSEPDIETEGVTCASCTVFQHLPAVSVFEVSPSGIMKNIEPPKTLKGAYTRAYTLARTQSLMRAQVLMWSPMSASG